MMMRPVPDTYKHELTTVPCQDAIDWLASLGNPPLAEAWRMCERADWMLRALWTRHEPPTPRAIIKIASALVHETPVNYGHTVFDLLDDARSRDVIALVDRWLAGEPITGDQLSSAWYAAALAAEDASVTWRGAAAGAADSVGRAATTTDGGVWQQVFLTLARSRVSSDLPRPLVMAAQADIIRKVVPAWGQNVRSA